MWSCPLDRIHSGFIALEWASSVAVAIYLGVLNITHNRFKSQNCVRIPYFILFGWNAALAVFSVLGAINTVPYTVRYMILHGLSPLLCKDIFQTVGEGAWAWWSVVFVCSKYVELGDTMFLVIRGKKLTLLHVYHHASVLMFAWHAFIEKLSLGVVFVSVNYSVHSIMYIYYAQASLYNKKPKWGLVVTLAQIGQMIVGLWISVKHIQFHYMDPTDCEEDIRNLFLALFLYVSYLLLFLDFFIRRYLVGPGAHSTKKS